MRGYLRDFLRPRDADAVVMVRDEGVLACFAAMSAKGWAGSIALNDYVRV